MAKSTDLEKTWKPGPSTEQTFNAPGNFSVPYGRYKATVSGRGGSGNQPTGATWNTNYNTNYNTAFPIGNRPIAAQPAATWNTNYNTNYNVTYPVGNQPVTGYNPGNPGNPTYYNLATYVVGIYNIQSYFGGNTNIPVPGPQKAFGYPPSGTYYQYQSFTPGFGPLSPWTYCNNPPSYTFSQGYLFFTQFFAKQAGLPASAQYANVWALGQFQVQQVCTVYQAGIPGIPGNANYSTNYNVAYPIANQPLANRPAATWNTNYNTNYNTVYPIANQPLGNQPIATYTPGNAGIAGNALGVKLPGGPIDLSQFAGNPGIASPISPTVASYFDYPDGVTHPVSVPPGGSVVVKVE